MTNYFNDDTKTLLAMNQANWYMFNKHIHNFSEEISSNIRYNILVLVDNIMKNLDIKYWLTNGTALGFIRDNDFIPWDDDIDIDVYSEDLMPKFKSLVNYLINAGFVCRVVERGNVSKISAYMNNFKISIGAVYLEEDFRKSISCSYPKRFYENSIEFTYRDRKFNVPAPTDDYLSYLYKDWKTPTRSDNVREYNQEYLYR